MPGSAGRVPAAPASCRKGLRSGASKRISPPVGGPSKLPSSRGRGVESVRPASSPSIVRASGGLSRPASPAGRAPARRRRPGRRRAAISSRPNQRPVLGVKRLASRRSIRLERVNSARSISPSPALPRAVARRVSASPDSRSRVRSRARPASRKLRGTSRASGRNPRSSRAISGAALPAATWPSIRPEPSGAIRPASWALAPARSAMSSPSTTRLAPSDCRLTEMVPLPEFAPEGP